MLVIPTLGTNSPPWVPSDPEDHSGDRQANQRIGYIRSEGNEDGAAHDAEAHQGIDPRVVPIRYERCAVEAAPSTRPNDSGDEIAAEADQSRNSKRE